jgi:hypothetical protein
VTITKDDVGRLRMVPLRKDFRRRLNILGAGGVGSNLVAACLLSARDFMLMLFDFDKVELCNLNRTTLFSVPDALAETPKVVALQAVANNKGLHCTPVRVRVDRDTNIGRGTTIDARDTLDPTLIPPGTWIKLAYDGGSSVSFTWLPEKVADRVVDLNPGRVGTYDIVPSFYVPAAMLAVLTLRFMQFVNFVDITERRAGTFQCDLDDMVDQVAYSWEPTRKEGET